MILEILKQIKDACKDLEGLQMIDLDRGQLEQPQSYESVLQPALLVGIPNITWQDRSHGNQDGDMRFYTKTVIRLPQHQHYYLHTEHSHKEELSDENIASLLIEDAIHQELIKMPGVCRINTSFSFSGTFFIVQHTYTLTVDYLNQPVYTKKIIGEKPGISVILNT